MKWRSWGDANRSFLLSWRQILPHVFQLRPMRWKRYPTRHEDHRSWWVPFSLLSCPPRKNIHLRLWLIQMFRAPDKIRRPLFLSSLILGCYPFSYSGQRVLLASEIGRDLLPRTGAETEFSTVGACVLTARMGQQLLLKKCQSTTRCHDSKQGFQKPEIEQVQACIR